MVERKLGILFFISVVLAFFAGFFSSRILPEVPVGSGDDMFNLITESFERYYYYDIDEIDKHDAFIDSMRAVIQSYAKSNQDPYTRLISTPLSATPSDNESFVGIGINLIFEGNNIRITNIYYGSAAHRVLYPNDLIVGIVVAGEDILFDNLLGETEVLGYLSGELGDTKRLMVESPESTTFSYVDITYSEFATPSVYTVDLGENDIAYIKITQFAAPINGVSLGTAQIFSEILKTLELTTLAGQNKTLILDLRDNPGGSLAALHNQGIQGDFPGIVQQLLVRNLDNPAFTMIPKSGKVQYFYGGLIAPKPYDIKVLVNENSASAAEVLAAALKYEGGYELYGAPTFGKGVYQNQVRLKDIRGVRYSLAYTEGEWFYDDGKNVSNTPLTVTPITQTGVKAIDMPVFVETLSKDMVSYSLSAYQQFLNYRLTLTGENRLRTDGYFDQKTEDAVFAYTSLKLSAGENQIKNQTSRFMYDDYLDDMRNKDLDMQLQELIAIIKTS
ncbi:MAG: S41 family peptidase [Acholeplasmataceae bacterium]|nr:S41 family peptidase [Acholeplasmataceae bacterium]